MSVFYAQESAMRLLGRWVLWVGLMLAVPLHSEAQGTTQASGTRPGGRDSLLNGAVIGFAVGAALGIAFAYATRDSELDAGQYAYAALIFGGIGAGAGLGIDALSNRNPSVAVRSPRRVALGPRVSRKTAGIRVIMRW
jgi:hypothetical protein